MEVHSIYRQLCFIFNISGYVPVYTWGEELLQTSLQFQQDQPQLRLWVPKNVQSRTNQCQGGAVQQNSTNFLLNTRRKVLDDGGVLDIRAIITFKGKVGEILKIVYCQASGL